MENSEIGKSGDGFIDRSKVRILLCDNDEKSAGMLGLADILNCDPDLVVSDPSDGNTNSTTLISDATDDKARTSTNAETYASTHREGRTNINTAVAPMETVTRAPAECDECQPDVPGISDRRRGQVVLLPKKNELKIGGSSAFFTYVKSSTPNSYIQVSSSANEISSEHVKMVEIVEHVKIVENDNSNDFPGCQEHTAAYPFYISGVMNQTVMPPGSSYHKNLADVHNHLIQPYFSHYNHNPQCTPYIPGMRSYPFYPFMCLQPGQIPAQWSAHENNASNEGKLHKVDRRQAALMKIRQKRKDRCFDKKIRYVN